MPEASVRPSRWRVFAPGSRRGDLWHDRRHGGDRRGRDRPGHGKALGLTIATLFVFWLAHVYAQTLVHTLRGGVAAGLGGGAGGHG